MKTKLFKRSPTVGGRQRKNFFKIIKIILINEKLESFEMLQKALITKTYLHHHNFKRQLYINLDESKRYEFEMMIYHMLKNPQNNSFSKTDI